MFQYLLSVLEEVLTSLSSSPVPSSMVSSAGVVKIVVRQSTGKEGGPVPTLAVAPSPRVAPPASLSMHPHATTATPVRTTATLQIAQRTTGPATVHYTLAPPRIPSTTLNQPLPPRPVLKVVQPPPVSTEQPGERRSFGCYLLVRSSQLILCTFLLVALLTRSQNHCVN